MQDPITSFGLLAHTTTNRTDAIVTAGASAGAVVSAAGGSQERFQSCSHWHSVACMKLHMPEVHPPHLVEAVYPVRFGFVAAATAAVGGDRSHRARLRERPSIHTWLPTRRRAPNCSQAWTDIPPREQGPAISASFPITPRLPKPSQALVCAVHTGKVCATMGP